MNLKMPQIKFKAKLKKKRADGTIIYHENKIINFIFKLLNGGN